MLLTYGEEVEVIKKAEIIYGFFLVLLAIPCVVVLSLPSQCLFLGPYFLGWCCWCTRTLVFFGWWS